ncbi:MAG: 23S rRNA (pseudouridine(1915)-N(3))-methyltransferase RlmH [Bacteroides sp.]|nr:23S rRNA (pseudouridine(1915)-N(3))-methyltransferase RlmH [Ruminococcus flavefaciens]MCM1555174.1 23S rRNA (pseudouridine(1915)-N(3))-methyltransferase RlmH [Bacteroides sp.]
MQISFLQNGKTEEPYLREGIAIFEKRLEHYVPYKSEVIPALKNARNMPVAKQKQEEFALMKKWFDKSDCVILLDEHGKEYTSVEFASFLQSKMNAGVRNLMFVVGGPFGFAPEARAAAHGSISLSKMTFSHQMIRLLFTEQLYRALTILKGEPYHNE